MCHGRHLHQHRTTTARRPAEDVLARDPELRASDREREDTVARLREHGAAGRLDVDELEERIGSAYGARTRGELAVLVRDLPAEPRRTAPSRPTAHRSWPSAHGGHGWSAFVPVMILLVAIWAASGAGHPWFLWVMLWWGGALLLRTAPRRFRPR